MSFIKQVGHLGRELLLHINRSLSVKGEKCIVIFPWSTETGSSSSRERAYRLGSYLKQLGWRVVLVPPQLDLSQRQRVLRLEKPSVVFLQMARHPLNRPNLYPNNFIVFDIDDADFFDRRQVDAVNICCLESNLVIAGSTFIAQYCRQFNSNVHVQWTAMDMKPRNVSLPSTRKKIVAWGTSGSLAYSAERQLVGAVAKELIKRVQFELWIYGAASHSELTRFSDDLGSHGIKVRLIPLMNFADYHASLEGCAVGLHPVAMESPFSRGKSFGKLNSYMLMGVPVVVQHALDYPEFFTDRHNGMLAKSQEDWVEKIFELLESPQLRDSVAAQARIDFERSLSTKNVAIKMDKLLTASTL